MEKKEEERDFFTSQESSQVTEQAAKCSTHLNSLDAQWSLT